MSVTLTESAASHIRKAISTRGHGEGLRLGVKASGCTGYAYVVELVDKIEEGDQIFVSHDVKVIVDTESLQFIQGLELDYAKDGLNEGFKFNNPNVNDQCGCGESFNI